MRDNDPFNPEFKKERPFLRKRNKKRIIYYIIIMIALVYGSQNFIDSHLVSIEIRTITGKRINNISFDDGRCDVYIINHSPYKVKLILDEDVITNYDNGLLQPGVKYYFWFLSNSTETLVIGGAKS